MGIEKDVEDLLLSLPPESGRIVAGMLINEAFHDELGDTDVSKMYMEFQAGKLEEVKKNLVRSFISKRQAGEDISSVVEAATAISKIGFQESEHPRGEGGRFKSKTKLNGQPAYTSGSRQRVTTFDAVHALTGNHQFARQVANARSTKPSEDYDSAFTPELDRFRNLRDGARVLDGLAGPYLPAPLAIASTTASFVGQYGPEAQRAFGPSLDRTKYRYQGTERKIDPQLSAALTRIKNRTTDPNKARDLMVRGSIARDERNRPYWSQGPLLAYMENQLPDSKLAVLQRLSGHIPPSQGFIVDDKGQVSAQMVGKGDDWYLPFNLQNLGPLRGGEYVRTRSNGGLTTEDVYTGLMTGARAMTVVSHNGVYTMEFDDTLRGSRRYGQTAREMTERYGQLLDAVKSGKVHVNDIDPTRQAEIRDEVNEQISPDFPAERRQMFRSRLDREREDPTPSKAQQNEWATEWLENEAQNYQHRGSTDKLGGTKSGAYTVEEMIREKAVPAYVREQMSIDADLMGGDIDVSSLQPENIGEQAYATLESNPVLAARYMGRERDFDRFMANRENQYKASLRPLTLNGTGYKYAQDALKEQFPYFISNVSYQPLNKNPSGVGQDEGYVKPRFVRPEGAQAGYFDDTILGTSKISADRTRFQNFRVMSRKGPDRGSFEAGHRIGRDPGTQRPDTGGTPDTSGGSGGAARSIPVTSASTPSRREADLALAKHMVSRGTYSPHTTLRFGSTNPGGQPVTKDWMELQGQERFKPFTNTPEDFDQMSDNELHSTVAGMLKTNNEVHMLDLDDQLVQAHQNEGRPPAAIEWGRDHSGDQPHHVYEFGEQFRPGRSKADYATTWQIDPDIKAAQAFAGLPTDITDRDLVNEASSIIKDGNEHIAEVENDPSYPADARQHEVSVMRRAMRGAAKARQIARFHASAPDSQVFRTTGTTPVTRPSPLGGGAIPPKTIDSLFGTYPSGRLSDRTRS